MTCADPIHYRKQLERLWQGCQISIFSRHCSSTYNRMQDNYSEANYKNVFLRKIVPGKEVQRSCPEWRSVLALKLRTTKQMQKVWSSTAIDQTAVQPKLHDIVRERKANGFSLGPEWANILPAVPQDANNVCAGATAGGNLLNIHTHWLKLKLVYLVCLDLLTSTSCVVKKMYWRKWLATLGWVKCLRCVWPRVSSEVAVPSARIPDVMHIKHGKPNKYNVLEWSYGKNVEIPALCESLMAYTFVTHHMKQIL